MILRTRLAALLLALTIAAPVARSYADIAMTVGQVGGDVVFTHAGSIDLTGLPTPITTQIRGISYPVNALVGFGPGTVVDNATLSYDFAVDNTTAPANLGTGDATLATSFSGSYFSVNRTSIKVPLGYVSGSTIAGTMRMAGATIETLGLNASGAPYVWTLTNGQTITLTFLDPVAAPPSNAALKQVLLQKLKKLQGQLRAARTSQNAALIKRLNAQINALRTRIRNA
jgi:hypothetical protein